VFSLSYLRLALFCVALAGYGWSASYLSTHRSATPAPELLVTMPRVAQILFSAGDRHLAANLSGFRVLVAETAKMNADDYAVQARLQRDIAWLNPAHEDNYYIAANILPWGDQVDAAEDVLRKSVAARPFDFLPAFHVGFIHYHFRRDPAEGARWLLMAAPRAVDQGDVWSLQVVAAKWMERGYDTVTAANIVGAMAANAPPGGFRSYLKLRAQRLNSLAQLQDAARAYRLRKGQSPVELKDLVTEGLLREIPQDPLGFGFVILPSGEPGFSPK